VLTTDQASLLLDSIDTSTLVGRRDRALIGECAKPRAAVWGFSFPVSAGTLFNIDPQPALGYLFQTRPCGRI
jgi:hypothetical protein